jgi:hypothetical protein
MLRVGFEPTSTLIERKKIFCAFAMNIVIGGFYWQLQCLIINVFIFFSHGVRMSPLCTAATVWPILRVPDDR